MSTNFEKPNFEKKTPEPDEGSASTDRVERFDCSGPIDITLEIGPGRAEIVLEDCPDGGSVRISPHGEVGFTRDSSLTAALSWLSEQAASTGLGDLTMDVVSTAVSTTIVEYEPGRLYVATPKDLPLRAVPLRVRIAAPEGSAVTVRSGSAGVQVDGPSGSLNVKSGSGSVTAAHCHGVADVRTGSGDIRVETVLGALQAKTGSGDIRIGTLGGRAAVRTGSGDVRLREVEHDVHAQTGSGDVWIGDASGGRLDLTSGSGELRVGVHPGVLAELDLRSGSGKARSDFPLGGDRPGAAASLVVRGRTGSGDVLVTTSG